MRIFVTGATGFIGSAIVQELIREGHQVLGLARSEAAAQAVQAAGAEPVSGSLEDFDSLRRGAASADGVVHTAFSHDFSKFNENCLLERQVVEALGQALEGSTRPLIVSSALGALPRDAQVTETTMPATGLGVHPRVSSEQAADAVAGRGVRTAVVRLPPSVHGVGDRGFVPLLIRLAREKGLAAYTGEGLNHWPAVHRLDAARVYRLVLDKMLAEPATPAGSDSRLALHLGAEAHAPRAMRYHAIAEEGVPFREIARVIGRRLNLPTPALSPEDAQAHFGWFSALAALDVTASNRLTRQRLGWEPLEPQLISDIDQAAYFEDQVAA